MAFDGSDKGDPSRCPLDQIGRADSKAVQAVKEETICPSNTLTQVELFQRSVSAIASDIAEKDPRTRMEQNYLVKAHRTVLILPSPKLIT